MRQDLSGTTLGYGVEMNQEPEAPKVSRGLFGAIIIQGRYGRIAIGFKDIADTLSAVHLVLASQPDPAQEVGREPTDPEHAS